MWSRVPGYCPVPKQYINRDSTPGMLKLTHNGAKCNKEEGQWMFTYIQLLFK